METALFILGAVVIYAISRFITWLSGKLSHRSRSLKGRESELLKRESALNTQQNVLSGKQSLLESQSKQFEQQLQRLKQFSSSLDIRSSALDLRDRQLEADRSRLNDLVRDRTIEMARTVAARSYLAGTPAFSVLREPSCAANDRLRPALTSSMHIQAPFDISARIVSSSGRTYNTTLFHCNCSDYQFRGQPCKHMMRLSLETGLLLSIDKTPLVREVGDLMRKQADLSLEVAELAARKEKVSSVLKEKSQKFPALSALLAERESALDASIEEQIKGPPRSTAKEERTRLRLEKKRYLYEKKLLEHQLLVYETLFPWLEDFRELTPAEAAEASLSVVSDSPESEYESLNRWLSADEYSHLSDADKYQLALDRWKRRSLTSWEAGIAYERYIGYLHEQRGYCVTYFGATHGKEDMGRDLIAENDSEVLIIQCKRYAASKEVHENTVFQLYGSCVVYSLNNITNKRISPVLYTSSHLSKTAAGCADRLSVTIHANTPLSEYPLVKCNVSKSGEKIYHLPFDQQYDRVVVTPKKGEFYMFTVHEAEDAGFRRAWRWHGSTV